MFVESCCPVDILVNVRVMMDLVSRKNKQFMDEVSLVARSVSSVNIHVKLLVIRVSLVLQSHVCLMWKCIVRVVDAVKSRNVLSELVVILMCCRVSHSVLWSVTVSAESFSAIGNLLRL